MLLTLIINTNYLPLLPASLCFTHRELLTFQILLLPLRVKLQIVKPYASP